MDLFILESSRADSRPQNMFHHLTWLFIDSEIARELGFDMVPKSWDPDYEKIKSMCAEIILECRKMKNLIRPLLVFLYNYCFADKSLHI